MQDRADERPRREKERRTEERPRIRGSEAGGTRATPPEGEPADEAAPPDAAGGRGSFTRPADVLTPRRAGEGGAAPDLHRDPGTAEPSVETDAEDERAREARD